jgi:hypothetical protein
MGGAKQVSVVVASLIGRAEIDLSQSSPIWDAGTWYVQYEQGCRAAISCVIRRAYSVAP